MAKTYRLSKRSLSRLEKVSPLLIAIFVEAMIDSPHDFGIPQYGGFRTDTDQNILYKKGVSQRDGYKKKSYHQTGNAIDIYGYADKEATWNKDILESIAKHIMKVARDRYDITLTWGGDWDGDGIRVDKDKDEHFFDGAHFQM